MLDSLENTPSRRYVSKQDAFRNQEERHAMVQWWNSTSVYVKCPFCNRIHRHGFDNDYSFRSQLRTSHCFNQDIHHQSYYLDFPFSEATGESHYEINRDRGLFVAAGADLIAYYGDDEIEGLRESFEQQLRSKRKWEDATERITWAEFSGRTEKDFSHGNDPSVFVDDYKRIDHAASQLVLGGVQYVRHFLQTSPESHLFLRGIDDDSGKTALHYAACEQRWEMVQLLLQHGVEVNAQDGKGRTPLMEAALWGRVDNAIVLLDHGADPALVCLRQNRTLRAIDLARASEENQEERSTRARGVYKEDVDAQSKNRKTIENLLFEKTDPVPIAYQLRNFAMTALPEKSNIRTLFAMFDVPESKALGVIWRGPKFPTVAAMSSYTLPAYEERNITIGGKDWTPIVLKLYKEMNLVLEPHSHDRGIRGQYYACHVEKQLIAWFIDRHLIKGHSKGNQEQTLEDDLVGLNLGLENEPPVSLKRADIMVCRDVCSSCNTFVKEVNTCFGLKIRLHGYARDGLEENKA